MADANNPNGLFELFKAADYRFGHCSVRPYDRRDTARYPDDFLIQLYRQCGSTIPTLFCGMHDLSAPSICAYLSTRNPLLLMCVDKPDSGEFDIIGFSFPTIIAGPAIGTVSPDPGRSMFAGLTGFKPWWGTPELVVCTMLSAIYYFETFQLLTIQSQSYVNNRLVVKFLSQFGFKEVAVIPKLLFNGKQMQDSIQTCLERKDFEDYVARTVAECSLQ